MLSKYLSRFLIYKSCVPRFSFVSPKKSIGIPSFQNYSFIESIQKYLNDKNVTTPSPIQQLVYEHYLNRKNSSEACFVGGPTGSGKTLAYILPMIQRIKEDEVKYDTMFNLPQRPRVIVLAPSKELIDQIFEVAKEVSHFSKVKVEKIDVARSWKKNSDRLKDGVDILVTNLNKLQRLVEEKKVVLSNLDQIIIDEADVFI